MKTLAVTVANKKQELLFTHLAEELGIEITVAQFKPLSTKEAVLGIARKFTDKELVEYIERKSGGKPKTAAKVKIDLKNLLAKKLTLNDPPVLPEAENALFEIGKWVEDRNTKESGFRYLNKLIDKIATYALPSVKYPICKNKVLASYKLSCISINEWVIAFSQTKDEFVVHFILFGPGLK